MVREEIILVDPFLDGSAVSALTELAKLQMFNAQFFTKKIGLLVVSVIQH